VSNTIVSDNTGSGYGNPFGTGILVRPTGSAVVTGVLSKVTVNNNSLRGIDVDGRFTTGPSLKVTIVDSEASNNGSGVGVSGVSIPTIKRLEATGGELGGRPETGEKIIAALEKRPAVMDIPELHAFINSRALPWRPGGVATKTCLPG
jgi:hypothetical protein